MSPIDPLAVALDRFDVPPMRADVVDRVLTIAKASTARRRRTPRDRWRLIRRGVIGTATIALVSAAAVASGLLSRVGVEVPVLSAMLAPAPVFAVPPTRRTAVAKRVHRMRLVAAAPAEVAPARIGPIERTARRSERRQQRRAFAADHPIAAARIADRIEARLAERAALRRERALVTGGDPLVVEHDLRRAARLDRWRAARLVDRRIRAFQARQVERGRRGANSPGRDLLDRYERERPPQLAE